MSRNFKFHDQEKPYFVTLTTVLWIDVFTRRMHKDLFVENVSYCIENKGLIVYAWCLMSNHAHMIIGTNGQPMQNILRDFKKIYLQSIDREDQTETRRKQEKLDGMVISAVWPEES